MLAKNQHPAGFMKKYFSINNIGGKWSEQLDQRDIDFLTNLAVCEVANRSVAGTMIVPFCFLLVFMVSGFNDPVPEISFILGWCMLIGVVMRTFALFQILRGKPAFFKMNEVSVFFVGCLLMALAWGLLTAGFITVYGADLNVVLILILSAGFGSGAVGNFCLWKPLAWFYLLLSLGPGILAGACSGQRELYPIIIGMAIFVLYIGVQIKHWSRLFWDSLINAYLYEREAGYLSGANEKLNVVIAKEKESHDNAELRRIKLRELFDHAGDGIIICNLHGVVEEFNEPLLRILRLQNDSLRAGDLVALFGKLGIEDFPNHWKAVSGGLDVDFDCDVGQVRGKNDLSIGVNLRQVSLQNDVVVFVTIRDITDRRNAENALALTRRSLSKSEGYLQAILRNIELPIYCKDLDGRYLTVNSPFERLCLVRREAIVGKDDFETFPTNIARFFSSRDSELIDTGNSLELEGTFSLAGVERNLLIHKFPLREKDGAIYGIAGICTDVTTMKKALQAAQLANEAKSEFLANMSHELRTPMHSILSFARLGLKRITTGSKEKVPTYLEMIVTSGDQLLELLNNLLELSQLESAQTRYQMMSRDLIKDLRSVVAEFQLVVSERNLSIKFNPQTDRAIARYDKTKIFQVFRNLLSNAIKFIGKGQEIRIIIEQCNTIINGTDSIAWKITISDQGVGIEEGELQAIFGKFVQGSKTKTGAGGVGLGLSICQQIIDDHGGTIWAENKNEGGATFCVLIPVSTQ